MKRIRLSLEYACHPIWLLHTDGGVEDIGLESIPISDSLKHDIDLWDNTYQSTYDPNCPQDSGFSSESSNELLSKAFDEEGRFLFHRLKKELKGLYEVTSLEYNG